VAEACLNVVRRPTSCHVTAPYKSACYYYYYHYPVNHCIVSCSPDIWGIHSAHVTGKHLAYGLA